MKRILSLIFVAVFVVGMLAACGGTKPEPTSGSDTPAVSIVDSGKVEPASVATSTPITNGKVTAVCPDGFVKEDYPDEDALYFSRGEEELFIVFTKEDPSAYCTITPLEEEFDITDNQGREWHFEHRTNHTDAYIPFDDGYIYISFNSETPDKDAIAKFVDGCNWQ